MDSDSDIVDSTASLCNCTTDVHVCCLQPAKVTAHWHKGTAFVIKFDESVIARDKLIEGR